MQNSIVFKIKERDETKWVPSCGRESKDRKKEIEGEGTRERREDFKHGRRWKEREPSGRARWAVNLYPGQPLGAISGSFEVPPWPGRRYKDKLCLRHRHALPLYTIILQADPRNGHSISADERRDVPRSPSLSFSPHDSTHVRQSTAHRTVSLPLIGQSSARFLYG